MDAATRGRLEFTGVTLALIAAAMHASWGLPRFFIYLGVGRMPDLRPPAFTLSAFMVVLAVVLIYRGWYKQPLYTILVVVMVFYLVGYVAWHVTGHPILVSGPDGLQFQTQDHPGSPVGVVLNHLLHDSFALVSAIVELGAIAALLGVMAAEPE